MSAKQERRVPRRLMRQRAAPCGGLRPRPWHKLSEVSALVYLKFLYYMKSRNRGLMRICCPSRHVGPAPRLACSVLVCILLGPSLPQHDTPPHTQTNTQSRMYAHTHTHTHTQTHTHAHVRNAHRACARERSSFDRGNVSEIHNTNFPASPSRACARACASVHYRCGLAGRPLPAEPCGEQHAHAVFRVHARDGR
jgi:hypothetical protein